MRPLISFTDSFPVLWGLKSLSHASKASGRSARTAQKPTEPASSGDSRRVGLRLTVPWPAWSPQKIVKTDDVFRLGRNLMPADAALSSSFAFALRDPTAASIPFPFPELSIHCGLNCDMCTTIRRETRATRRVRPGGGTYGEETTDEMALLFLLVAVPRLEDAAAFNRAQAIGVIDRFFADGIDPVAMAPAQTRGLRMAFTHFDANHNGALEPEERTALLRFLRLIP